MTEAERPLVWDWPLRLWHWLLALTLAGSWLTAELGFDYREWHMRLGYGALGLIVFRLCWGVLGNRYARFPSWWPAPRRLLTYLRELGSGAPGEATAGHTPLGGLAAWALLSLVTVQAVTGLFVDDDILYIGPYKDAVSGSWQRWLNGLHHSNFDWLLAMIALHLLAIAAYRVFKKQRLVSAMISGRASVPAALGAHNPSWWRILLALGLAVGSVWLLLELAPEPVYDDFY